MSYILIRNSGALTTVQDLGRYGFQKIGMPVAGVMDQFAARCANLLVNNPENAALLEATLTGPEVEFTGSTLVAVTGADMSAEINGVSISLWKSYLVKEGDILKLNAAKSGVRSYISFSGGIDVPITMGSRSTYIKGGIGGFNGRKLMPGDTVKLIETNNFTINNLSKSFIPSYSNKVTVRAVLGPNEEYFSKEGINDFFSTSFTTGSRSDRMGIFLEGLPIKLAGESTDILSSAILMGSIQVSSDGTPIVLMADRQTTGGYAQIATVITPDLWKLAQVRPGNEVCFEQVSIEEAAEIYKEYESKFSQMNQIFERQTSVKSVDYLNLSVNGKTIKAIIEEI